MPAAAATPFAARLADVAARHAARPYLIFEGHAVTYAETARHVAAAARFLADQGVAPGDRVMVLLGNVPSCLYTIFGAWLLGAAAVPVNPEQTARELGYLLEHAAPRLVVTGAAHADRHAATLGAAGIAVAQVDDEPPPPGPRPSAEPGPHTSGEPQPDVPPGPDALIIYTSGSSGRPKGVVLTQGNVLANATSVAQWYTFSPADRLLTVLPLSFINPIIISSLAPLLAGASTVLGREFGPFGLPRFWQLVDEHDVNILSAVPSIYGGLLRLDSPRGREAARKVRLALCGGAAPAPGLVRAFGERYGCPPADNYGLTETTCWATMSPPDPVRRRPSSAGIAVDCEARVIDDRGRPLPPGALGEVVIRGANVTPGYWRGQGLTAELLEGGWLHTGDVGSMDGDGFVYIHGRRDDMVIRRGVNIYPREVDDVLLEHPQVTEARTIGVPSELDGQELVAYVTVRDAAAVSARDLMNHCRARLSHPRRPREVRIVDRLPTTPSGKVATRLLREGLPRD
jgi:acyl-CoA synthetase (AMP-forming)/AMP-acid ligase II